VIAPLMARGVIDLAEKAVRAPWAKRGAAIALWVCAAGAVAFAVGVVIASGTIRTEWVVLAAVFGATAACAVVVVRWLPRAWTIAAPVAALMAWGAAFGALGHGTALGNERPGQVDVLARAVAEAAGPTTQVITIGFDRDDLIYRLNRPIDRVPRNVEASELLARGPAIVVATPKELDKLAAEGLELVRGDVYLIEDTERFEIARIVGGQNE